MKRVTGSEIGRVASGARRGQDLMVKSAQKVTLSPSRDIPFDKLVLSQSNVRHIKAGISTEELAEDIARRGLLQSLSVRPVLAEDDSETGKFEIPAGGRRFQALSLLVKQKRLAKTTPFPCIVRDSKSTTLAEDDSLAENMQRVALHPIDQFRAFFVTPQVVKQRPKLAAVAPALLDRLVSEKLQAEAEAIATEGWKWIEVSLDLPYGYSHGLLRLSGDPAPMPDDEGAAHAKLLAEYRALEEEYEGQNEFPEEIDARLGALKVAMEKLEARPLMFDDEGIGQAGAFVTLDRHGELAV